ncbi:MAG: 3-deoxy-8-phosphooctulonate synthase [Candidatus Scalindua sp. AMX11]|nr:MAG: 3-deoxy-8-phosphooctulonate synthase [Candidatus Scalindua sp.]NOG82378.1 3-deoxy-8-phosphooctulonate synthase [Planctomycetota bacterium]RZV70579.1 MAG: 3-deoxy-8-phosphooctulonate synthase [Candidatus Scalindua sp. SCAELEC01]TDE64190.1 MAG: 3-deoxy-8-phosphooctulonate synthase [Candidatus Scalindua sp. AMX11]GJQ60463.1 MAG: 2-dehydro-3-deoxyphosphooctonate aldolase [Candidatus Scalindua sp.]
MSQRIVKVGNIECGSDELFLISGPCVIEEESLMLKTAEILKTITNKLRIPLIFKSSFQKDNRSSLSHYVGPGIEKGLRILEKIKREFRIPVISDVHYPQQIDEASEVLDIIQIPAYLCMQTELIILAAKTNKPINIKHGQFLAPENMIKPVQKVEEAGSTNILLTERGYTFGYNDLVVDPRSFYHLNRIGYPVIFDITHCIRRYGIPSADPQGGTREFLPVIARSGVAAGIDGLFIETHPDPPNARCDAASQIQIEELEGFVRPLMEIHSVVKNL